ncbi:MAG: hypothetical protein KUG64_10825 [Cycloclasticus sp.]|nr:hypothetical protein [Cycloclasticus sp.]
MRQHTVTTTVYSFDELSDEAKQNALDNNRGWNTEHLDWADSAIDRVEIAGSMLGINVDRVLYTGFCSQGDGACFEGDYSYKKGAVKAISEEFNNEELTSIAERLQALQKDYFYTVTASVKHSGSYCHENSNIISVKYDEDVCGYRPDWSFYEREERITCLLREFMQWSYSELQSEYEYLTSDTVIQEILESNKMEFTEDGDLL